METANTFYERLAIAEMFDNSCHILFPEFNNMYQYALSILANRDNIESVKPFIKTYLKTDQSELVEYLLSVSDMVKYKTLSMSRLLYMMKMIINKKFDLSCVYRNNYAFANFLSLSCLHNKIDDLFKVDAYDENCKNIVSYLTHYNIKNSYVELAKLLGNNKIIDYNTLISLYANVIERIPGAFATMRDTIKNYLHVELCKYFQYALNNDHPDALFYEFFINDDIEMLKKSIKLGSIYAYDYLAKVNFHHFNSLLITEFRKDESDIKYIDVNVDIDDLYDNELFKTHYKDIYENAEFEHVNVESDAKELQVELDECDTWEPSFNVCEPSYNELKEKYDKELISSNELKEKLKEKSDECDKWKQYSDEHKKASDELQVELDELKEKYTKELISHNELKEKFDKLLEDLLNEKNETIKKLTNAVMKLSGIE